jgi:hypothetical protein
MGREKRKRSERIGSEDWIKDKSREYRKRSLWRRGF